VTNAEAKTTLTVSSPDDSIEVTVELADGVPQYSVAVGEEALIEPSPIGFEFADQPPFATAVEGSGPALAIADSKTTEATEKWTPEWGSYDTVAKDYRQLTLELEERTEPGRVATLDIRVFDDGLGFRVELGDSFGEFAIDAETTEFVFAGDYTAWWIENEFVNPRYEQEYAETPLSEIPAGTKRVEPTDTAVRRGAHTPLTMRTADGTYLSVLESGVEDYPSTSLASVENHGSEHMVTELAPLPDGTKVEASAPHITPWRAIAIADRPGGLIESQLVPLLAPERDDEALPTDDAGEVDTDWLEPKKYLGVWWLMIAGSANWEYKSDEQLHAEGQDPARYIHGARTERAKRYMHFASEHGFDSVLVEGWNEGWDTYPGDGSGFEMGVEDAYPDFDLEDVLAYGDDFGVELTIHNETAGNVVTYEREIGEDIFAEYEQAGIGSIKNGYVSDPGLGFEGDGAHATHTHHCQTAVEHHREVIRRAASERQLLEIHEGIEPSGEIRTYPNVGAREVVKAQEYDGFGDLSADVAREHHVVLPFTRMLAGPTSYQPGIFDLTFNDDKPDRVQTTLAKQLAMYPAYLGGLQMAADRIEAYIDSTLAVGQFLQAPAGELDGMLTDDDWRNSFGAHYVPIDPSREPEGASVSFTVEDVPEAGTYDLHLRYAADAENNRQTVIDNGGPEATLRVNGHTQSLTPPWTDYWDDWAVHTISVMLSEGDNTVAIELGAGDVGGFNLDAVAISEMGPHSPLPADYEAVDPSLENVDTVPAFDFVKQVPLSWDETRVLDAAIGDYVVIARRTGEEWYLGAMTDEQAREVEVELDFLAERDGGWRVTEYADATETDVEENPTEIDISEYTVEAGEPATVEMVESGGTAMRIRPVGEGR